MQDLQEWLAERGFTFNPILDDKPHRFATPEDEAGEKSGWYLGSQINEIITLTVSDWRTDDKLHFRSGGFNGHYEDYKKQVGEKDKDFEEEKRRIQEETAVSASRIYNSASLMASHPYLYGKGFRFSLAGFATTFLPLRQDGETLIVPCCDIDRKIWGIQRIYPDGTKRFLTGQRKRATFYLLPGLSAKPICICEGVATGLSIHLATGSTTVIAFDAGNLESVARTFRDNNPGDQIFICADDDAFSKNNPGRNKAIEAANGNKARVIFPKFKSIDDKPTDFNDLHVKEGLEEVKRQIEEGMKGQGPEIATAPAKEIQPKKITEEAILELAKEILDIRFKIVRNSEATILFNITNIKTKELKVCLNDEFLLGRLRDNIQEKWGILVPEIFLWKLYRSWKLSADSVEEPAPFCWSNEDKWTFRKLDFVPCEGMYPNWQEFLSRLSAPEDFMAFVWSIFESRSASRQFLYLYGPNGQDGKSTVINVLGEVFGNSYCAINNTFVSGAGNRWLLGNIYGKRLVGWPDCKNPKFCMSEMLRNITSGDDVAIEFKGKQPFTSHMYVKFIVASNSEPAITGGGADMSRLIRIDVEKNAAGDDPEWKPKIRAELPYFLWACKKQYDAKCPKHGNINLNSESHNLADISTIGTESRWEAMAKTYLTFGKNLEAPIGMWEALCKEERLSNIEIGNFKDYLRQEYGVQFKRRVVDFHKITYCVGVFIHLVN